MQSVFTLTWQAPYTNLLKEGGKKIRRLRCRPPTPLFSKGYRQAKSVEQCNYEGNQFRVKLDSLIDAIANLGDFCQGLPLRQISSSTNPSLAIHLQPPKFGQQLCQFDFCHFADEFFSSIPERSVSGSSINSGCCSFTVVPLFIAHFFVGLSFRQEKNLSECATFQAP